MAVGAGVGVGAGTGVGLACTVDRCVDVACAVGDASEVGRTTRGTDSAPRQAASMPSSRKNTRNIDVVVRIGSPKGKTSLETSGWVGRISKH